MRFRFFHRRLTLTTPRMTVRSAMPWPLRWVIGALVLGFCGALSLWAFETGKSLAGVDGHSKQELIDLRKEVVLLREERDRNLSVINTSGSMITAEKAAQEKLAGQLKQLEAENQALRSDLSFFETLIPSNTGEALAIRSLQAEPVGSPPTKLKWQVLVIQPSKNAPDFKGKLDLTFTGTQNGAPWTLNLPGGPQTLQLKQYRRVEGLLDLPPNTVVQSVVARVLEGSATRAVQNLKL